MIQFKWGGLSDIVGNLKKIADKFPDYVAAAMYQEAQLIMTESKKRCPVDTGLLRASGRVAEPERGFGRHITVTLSYGGAAVDYAIYVHENLTARHYKPYGTGGQAKFLESVIDESAATLAERIAARVDLNKAKLF